MNRLLALVRTQAIALVALLLALSSVAYAASLQIGTANTADKPTTLTNTGPGPALRVNVKPGSAPFSVNSSRVVQQLNASQLQGKGASAFAKAGSSYTKAQSDGRYPVTLYSGVLEGTITGIAVPTVMLDQNLDAGGNGVLIAYLVGTWEGGFGHVQLKIDGSLVGEIFSDHAATSSHPDKAEAFVGVNDGGAVITATLLSDDPTPPKFSGHIAVLFVPD